MSKRHDKKIRRKSKHNGRLMMQTIRLAVSKLRTQGAVLRADSGIVVIAEAIRQENPALASYTDNRAVLQAYVVGYAAKPLPASPRKGKKAAAARLSFYESDEWRELRYAALKALGGACMLCGRTRREHGVVIHVDHIQPRSKRPDLELELTNLQILCADCNLGKSNRDSIDWSQGPQEPPAQAEPALTPSRPVIYRRRNGTVETLQ